ncbi:MAG: cell division protein FtsL [Bacillota bacterium]
MSRTTAAYVIDYAPELPRHKGVTAPVQPVSAQRPQPARRALRLGKQAVVAYIAVLVVMVLGALLMVSQYSAMASVSYQIADMKKQIAAVDEQNEALEKQVAELKRPDRIMEIATTQLGMVSPEDFQQATTAPLVAQAQEPDQGGTNSTQVAQGRGGFTLSAALDRIGRGLSRLLAGPVRTEAKGK